MHAKCRSQEWGGRSLLVIPRKKKKKKKTQYMQSTSVLHATYRVQRVLKITGIVGF